MDTRPDNEDFDICTPNPAITAANNLTAKLHAAQAELRHINAALDALNVPAMESTQQRVGWLCQNAVVTPTDYFRVWLPRWHMRKDSDGKPMNIPQSSDAGLWGMLCPSEEAASDKALNLVVLKAVANGVIDSYDLADAFAEAGYVILTTPEDGHVFNALLPEIDEDYTEAYAAAVATLAVRSIEAGLPLLDLRIATKNDKLIAEYRWPHEGRIERPEALLRLIDENDNATLGLWKKLEEQSGAWEIDLTTGEARYASDVVVNDDNSLTAIVYVHRI